MFLPPEGKRWVYLRADQYGDDGHPTLLSRCHFADATHMRLAPTDEVWWAIVAIEGKGTVKGGGQWRLTGEPDAPTLSPSISVSEGGKQVFHGWLTKGVFTDA